MRREEGLHYQQPGAVSACELWHQITVAFQNETGQGAEKRVRAGMCRGRERDSAKPPGGMGEDRAAHLSSLLPEDKGA